jgi:biopolymer transport protein ExbD
MPAPTASASAPTASNSEPGDLSPVELDGGGTSVVDQANQLEVHADGTISLSGLQLPLEDLKMKLAKMKEADETLKVKLKINSSKDAEEPSKELLEFLELHSIGYEVKQ